MNKLNFAEKVVSLPLLFKQASYIPLDEVENIVVDYLIVLYFHIDIVYKFKRPCSIAISTDMYL